ncbi:uncharacterized protein LOC108092747 [Drosophila ficusphila]|uniref:uncharacterized protein LOC108092747 n=1 Tax=Drosophila ficusphila TaxID=30025 RepID=UPI0007E81C86|nr:uncharacterized protein LOC108092747 [Drosophila ficusphila]
MFRVVFHAILVAIYFLSIEIIFNKGICESGKRRQNTVKTRVMSNVSLALYWVISWFTPYEIVEDEKDWDIIDGRDEMESFHLQ